jgi:hypothetical protein
MLLFAGMAAHHQPTPPGMPPKPFTLEDFERILREAGWTASDMRRCRGLAELHELGETVWPEMLTDIHH